MSKYGRVESDTDRNSVTILHKRGPVQRTIKSNAELSAAQRSGAAIQTSKKIQSGGNRQHQSDRSAAILDEETEMLHHERVPLALGKVLQQARQAKEWSQKDLATHINEKSNVIIEYECGKAIPNQQILAKMERALGVKLRGKEMGQPLQAKAPKKK